MSIAEELKVHLDKISVAKQELKLAQENWIARNKIFNDWAQKTLGVENQQGELHLTEILTKWEEKKRDECETEIKSTLATT